jgi:AcrR family transcriptional regulator
MPKKVKSSKTDIRKTEILEYFQEVLGEEGFEGASMAKIARKMGVNPSLLIHYFSTKEEMVLALVDFVLEKYESLILEKTREVSGTEQRLETLVDTLFSKDWISVIDTSAFYSCYYLTFRNQKVKRRMQKLYQRFAKGLKEILESGMEEGIICKDDPEKLADFIIYLVEGLSFYRNISGGNRYYVGNVEYLKDKVWSMLRKQENEIEIESKTELLQFKKETTKLVKDLQKQVDQLSKKIINL